MGTVALSAPAGWTGSGTISSPYTKNVTARTSFGVVSTPKAGFKFVRWEFPMVNYGAGIAPCFEGGGVGAYVQDIQALKVTVTLESTSPVSASFGPIWFYAEPSPPSNPPGFLGFNLCPGGRILAVFAVSAGTVATPTISPNGGNYSSPVSVTLACATPGATIRYTTNGAVPTSVSSVYSTPLTLTSTTTVRAKAFASGYSDSAVVAAGFNFGGPPAPTMATFLRCPAGHWRLSPCCWPQSRPSSCRRNPPLGQRNRSSP